MIKKIIENLKKLFNEKSLELYGYKFISMENPDLDNVNQKKFSAIDLSFILGKIYAEKMAKNPKVKIEDIKKMNKELTSQEKEMIKYLKERGFNLIKNLYYKTLSNLDMSLENIYNEKLKNPKKDLEKIFIDAIKDKKTRSQIESDIRHKVKQITRDWGRVVTTEMQNANQYGIVGTIMNNKNLYPKGEDTLVYKIVRPDACPYCKQLYLENGKPKIFKLKDLFANGVNTGSPSSWKPVVGVTHPNCTCQLAVIPDGFEFDDDGNLIPKKGG